VHYHIQTVVCVVVVVVVKTVKVTNDTICQIPFVY